MAVDQVGAAGLDMAPGRSSLTAGAMPRTMAELGAGLVKVTADRLNVRKAPQIEAGNIVGGLEHGHVVNAIAPEGDWLRIIFGVTPAYVHKGFVEPAGATAQLNAGAQHIEGPAAAPAVAVSSVASRSAPEAMAQPANDDEFTTASGNSIAKTTPAEAAVLNKIRRDPRRLDPVWLEAAQHALGVHDATGGMNTETLRAMREHAHQPKLDATGIMNEAFLTAIAPGAPFHEGVETGENKDKQAADPTATTVKDRMAQGLGFADFQAYYDTWGEDNVVFVGQDLGAPAHPYLRARLRVAEAYLRNRVKSPNGQPLDDAGIRKAIGWNGQGNASYSHKPGTDMHLTHPHAVGLAIDIDPGQNPYFFDHSVANADFWVGLFERLFQYATKLYGGEALTAKTMETWSKETSTEELFPRIKASSQSFAKLLELSVRAHGDESPTGEIARSLVRVGYEGDALKTATHEVAVADHHFHQQQGRKDAKQATNLTQELVIALRDVAGLAWGGTEMSTIENGDFMHFDCRLTDFGQSVAVAAAAAHKKPAKK
ncbi:MAG TPA: hypothetical protein VH165_04720 [Kofleriaceae bacterium]|jgi:hypothetical protein|nr:hypothetical protein [Kofleriaceae bacterium]